jgi:hypothetical protein
MGTRNTISISGKVWRYPGPSGWYFVNVGMEESARIRFMEEVPKVGFGFIRIDARTGKSKWSTTLFPTKDKDFLIAIKASVRKAEKIEEGDTVRIDFTFVL